MVQQSRSMGCLINRYIAGVCKYEVKGVDGLIDKRDKRKPLDEMNEVEHLRAENKILKQRTNRKKWRFLC